jgi:hypothetical protein
MGQALFVNSVGKHNRGGDVGTNIFLADMLGKRSLRHQSPSEE